MTLTFDIHCGSYTHLLDCIYQLSYHRPQYFVLPFIIHKLKGPYLTLLLNGSWSTQSHHFSKLDNTQVLDAMYQVSRVSGHEFWRRGFLKLLTIYGHGGHLGHVTWTIHIYVLVSPFPWGCIWNFIQIPLTVLEENSFESADGWWRVYHLKAPLAYMYVTFQNGHCHFVLQFIYETLNISPIQVIPCSVSVKCVTKPKQKRSMLTQNFWLHFD